LLLLNIYAIIPLMKRNYLIIGVIILVVILGGLIIKNKFFSQTGKGALQVSSTPQATVYLDGEQKGVTPYFNDKIESGEHTVKLVPEAGTENLVTWEGKVNLAPGIVTAINRTLGPTEAASSGEILSLEKIANRNTSSLAVISNPDGAMVKVNGNPEGFAPVLKENLTPGSYLVIVSSAGYDEKSINATTVAGYKLTVNAKLAQAIEGIAEATSSAEMEEGASPSPSPSPTASPKTSPKPSATPPAKPYVVIKETPTGWLRVRAEPSTEAEEVARVNPGEMYPYLEEEKNGWYKIEYEEGEEGWISGVYADLVE
jgi:hypothetical protein